MAKTPHPASPEAAAAEDPIGLEMEHGKGRAGWINFAKAALVGVVAIGAIGAAIAFVAGASIGAAAAVIGGAAVAGGLVSGHIARIATLNHVEAFKQGRQVGQIEGVMAQTELAQSLALEPQKAVEQPAAAKTTPPIAAIETRTDHAAKVTAERAAAAEQTVAAAR